MASKLRHLKVAGTKPAVDQIDTHELVVNEADGTLWSKNTAGDIYQISSGGGSGSGVGIDEMVLLQSTQTLYTAPDGSVYTRTGTVQRNVSDYPDATVQNDGSDYVGSKTAQWVTSASGTQYYYFVRIK